MDSFKDYRGRTVKAGTKVAYNQSGDVVIGIVKSVDLKEVKKGYGNWTYIEGLIEVRKIGGQDADVISKVRNHRCVVSIETEDS